MAANRLRLIFQQTIVNLQFQIPPDFSHHQPDQRIKPVNTERKQCGQLHQVIPAADMRAFVKQDVSQQFRIPEIQTRGQENQRTQHAGNQRTLNLIVEIYFRPHISFFQNGADPFIVFDQNTIVKFAACLGIAPE